MSMDPFLTALALLCVTEIDWSLASSSDDFLSYDFVAGMVAGHPTERTLPMTRQKDDNDPVALEFGPAFDANWRLRVASHLYFLN